MTPFHNHLRRLDRLFVNEEIYLITTCTLNRRRVLACSEAFDILHDEFLHSRDRHGWIVGRFVLMPDHLHVFAAPLPTAPSDLSGWMGAIKEWSAKRICAVLDLQPPLWQREFHDHLLRSGESYSQKWDYVVQNPVRAGLVQDPEQYPWQGEIEKLTL